MLAAIANPTQAQLQAMIVATAQQYGVDPSLALAIAQTESSFNPSAVSKQNSNGTQDFGLMQINSANFAALGLNSSTALDPQANLNAAMSLLAQYTNQYGDNPQLIAWAYNAGPGSVASGSVPASTSGYISTVLANQQNFAGYSDSSADSSSPADTLSLSDALDTGATDSSSGEISITGIAMTPALLAGGVGLLALLIVISRR
jgi:Transglycosylase SLT domain